MEGLTPVSLGGAAAEAQGKATRLDYGEKSEGVIKRPAFAERRCSVLESGQPSQGEPLERRTPCRCR